MPNTPVTWLNEFFVTNEVSPQDPDIIQLANGNILVSWSSTDDTGAGTSSFSDVVGQIFDPLGKPVGAPIQLNFNYTVDDELNSDLVALPGGGFIVVYQDNDVGGFTDLRLDEYDAAGNVVSSAPSIIEDGATGLPSYRNPHVAAASDTSALIVYEQTNASGTTVVGKLYDSTTNTYSSQQSLIGFTFNVTDPDVAVLTNGNYVITATDVTGGDARIAYRMVSATGANVLSASFIASTSGDGFTDNEASVSALAGGGFVITYTDRDSSDTDVAFSVFNAAGTEIGSGLAGSTSGSLTNDTNESAVSGLVDGSFVIVLDNDEFNTMEVTHVSSTGTVLGTFSFSGSGTEPAITDLGDGRFAVVWEDNAGGVKMEILDTRDFVNPTAVYTPEPNWQVGTINNDVFVTDGDADIVHGWTGNDDITDNGLSEDNQFFGDAGNDIMRVISDISGDLWDGGSGTDTLVFIERVDNGLIIDLQSGKVSLGANSEQILRFENAEGSNQDDTLIGSSVGNILRGNAGNDILDGGGGVDTTDGGAGNDVFFVSNVADVVIEALAEGADRVRSTANYTLGDGVYVEALSTVAATSTNAINLTGNQFNQKVEGNNGLNTLKGMNGKDALSGFAGADKLFGGLGSDTLDGGLGDDRFVFNTTLNASANVDTIEDFGNKTGDNDLVVLDNDIFAGLGTGVLNADAFKANTTGIATQADDHILYSTDTGNVYYDSNGNAAGGRTLFAVVASHPTLTASDFLVF